MSQPIHYVKDSKLFPVIIEDFASLMDGRQHEEVIGTAGNHDWRLTFEQVFQDQMSTLKVAIYYHDHRRTVTSLDVHYGFYIHSRHPTLSRFYQSRANLEPYTPIGTDENFLVSELLDENNGYVNDGDLTIQIEIRVLAIINNDDIRKFNFHDPFEGCVTLTSEDWAREMYVGKQLISQHSPFFAKEIRDGNSVIPCHYTMNQIIFNSFLQLLHGVPLSICSSTFRDMVRIADIYEVTNFQYCQLDEFGPFHAFLHLLPSNCAARIMRKFETEDKLRQFTSLRIDFLNKMSTEMLKTIVKKFFSLVADNDDNDKITVSE